MGLDTMTPPPLKRMGIGTVADGVPEVLKATRLNLRNGATQIKTMAGGGGSSRFDPIDTTQYSADETCAHSADEVTEEVAE